MWAQGLTIGILIAAGALTHAKRMKGYDENGMRHIVSFSSPFAFRQEPVWTELMNELLSLSPRIRCSCCFSMLAAVVGGDDNVAAMSIMGDLSFCGLIFFRCYRRLIIRGAISWLRRSAAGKNWKVREKVARAEQAVDATLAKRWLIRSR